MEKTFWTEVKANGYALPAEVSLLELTEELFSYLGSPDPELRDSIGYEVFANWLEQGRYTPDQLRPYILRLIVNLQEGLGEHDTDSVFLRSFSALCLAEIVNFDNKQAFLDRDEAHSLLARALEYLENEQDPRGYVHGQGWAHALAHTADLLFVLAKNRHLGREQQAQILDGVRAKLIKPAGWVYIHAEDDRLVRAVEAVIERKMLDDSALGVWLLSFSDPEGHSWSGSLEDENLQRAFFNSRAFLKSLYLKISQDDGPEKSEGGLPAGILEALQALRQF
jgi:hypothetical protein